jgi:hypothetical protein
VPKYINIPLFPLNPSLYNKIPLTATMTYSIYDASIVQIKHSLESLKAILKKAESSSKAAEFPETRLHPDMLPLAFQVHVVTNVRHNQQQEQQNQKPKLTPNPRPPRKPSPASAAPKPKPSRTT